MKNHDTEQQMQNAVLGVKSAIKNRTFDIIAVGIIIAMLALNLGVLELRDITFLSIINILLECIPFFITSVLLSTNYYHKGAFAGKSTIKFKTISSTFSDMVIGLSGSEIAELPSFCDEYNDKLLIQLRTNSLKAAAISFDRFDAITIDDKGNELQPLKILSMEELQKLYTDDQVNIILKTKKIKIRGLNPNLLLGNTNCEDSSDLGDDEKSLDKKNIEKSAITYLLSTLLLAMIGVKDILQWGWAGILITIFKLVYVVCSSAMKHFKGYNDITIHLTNHIARKTDILKQFKKWYSERAIVEKE